MKKLLLSAAACLVFMGLSAQTFILEDFTTFTNDTTPPIASGWKNLDSSSAQNGETWRFNDPGGRNIPAPFSGRWATLDSDDYGAGTSQDAYLQSPNFNASAATSVILEFDHVHIDLNDSANVEVFDGVSWNIVARYAGINHGTVANPVPVREVINISQWAAGVANAQIRFHYIGSYDWYWAIDNINVFQPVPDDAAALSVDSLESGCGLDSIDVVFTFMNAGSTPISNIPLQYTVNGLNAVNEVYTQTVLAGDTVTYTFNAKANVSTPGTYTIVANTAFRGDANLANDTTSGTVTHFGAQTLSYFEDFETLATGQTGLLANNWIIDATGAFEWRTNTGATGSFATGPTGDNTTGTGIYLYTEASAPASTGDITTLTSTCLDFGSGTRNGITLEYYYHMYGADILGLDVYLDSMGTWVLIDSIVGQQQSANTDPWLLRQVQLNSYVNLGSTAIRFEVERGASFNGDVAIDDVRLYEPTSTDVGVISIDSPGSGCGLSASEQVCVSIKNFGTAAISSFPVEVVINNGTPISATVSATIQPGDTLSYCFTATANLSTPGTYQMVSYTTATGDGDANNDSASTSVVNIPILSSYPYVEDFENGNGGWTSAGANSSWALGTPAGSVINAAAAPGSNSWVTNLTGTYNNNEESFVLGPCFDFTNLAAPQIKMDVWWNSEFSWDGAALQSSIDGGTTWQLVGNFGSPNNWYTDNTINGLAAIEPSQEGWTGRNSSANGSGGWVLAEHDLTGLGGISGVLLRVVFGSDGSVVDEGFAFDNVLIQNAPANDVKVLSLSSPISGCGLGSDSVTVCLANIGSAAISNFPLTYVINANTPVTENMSLNLNPGDTACFTFSAIANLSTTGTYNFTVYSALPGDGNSLNDTINAVVENIPILTTFPYTQDFENGTGGWTSGGLNSTWALGLPAGSVINVPAGIGTNSWVTNLTGNYNNGEESFVMGPCFDFTNLAAPQIKMDVWWNSEFSWDGAVLQSSIDGGTTWQNVGAFGSPNNWYTDNSINGLFNLANPQDGWTGRNSSANGSGGWVLAEHDLAGLGGLSGVLLRIAFGSDGSVDDEGFAFDNVLIQNAPANDIEVLSMTDPVTGCNLGNNPITVCMVNKGSAPTSNFPISYSLNSAAAVTDTVRQTILPGDTACFTFTTPTNLSTPALYNFVIYSSMAGDGNALNDTITNDVTHFAAQTVPYTEDFDLLGTGLTGVLPNNWIIDAPGAFEWRTNVGGTGSGGTGPNGDNTTGSGTYIYTEASAPAAVGEITTLTSTCLDFGSGTNSVITLEYYYHMFGADIVGLEVYLDSMGTWVMVDSLQGPQQFANADPWLLRQVNLNNYSSLGATAVRFQVVRGGGFAGDVSIDDFSLTTLPVSIENKTLEASQLTIFPNPNTGDFNLRLPSSIEVSQISVLDINGKLIDNVNISRRAESVYNIDLGGQAKGVYLLRVNDENTVVTKKVIVQ